MAVARDVAAAARLDQRVLDVRRRSAAAASVCTTPEIAETNAGSSPSAAGSGCSTFSTDGWLKPAALEHRAAPAPPRRSRTASPASARARLRCRPTIATTANTIQPNSAVFQCPALQRPARPARFSPAAMPTHLRSTSKLRADSLSAGRPASGAPRVACGGSPQRSRRLDVGRRLSRSATLRPCTSADLLTFG